MLRAPTLHQPLGAKHHNLNIRTNAILQQKVSIDQIILLPEDSDVDKLIKIDVIAKSSENLPLIEKVLCCDDMLLVSRAINKCRWLANDPRIAPDYLDTNLFPHMSSKAISKLLLSIRQNIKDQEKSDAFFWYFMSNDKADVALNWLPMCSPETIRKSIEESRISVSREIFKRIARKMPHMLHYIHFAKTRKGYFGISYLKAAPFLLRTNTDEYLNAVEAIEEIHTWQFNSKATRFLLKNRFERIMNMRHIYVRSLHLPTLARHIGRVNILRFLVDLPRDEKMLNWFSSNNLKPFILLLPEHIKESFFRCLFGVENDVNEKIADVLEFVKICQSSLLMRKWKPHDPKRFYEWYPLAPFTIVSAKAFVDGLGSFEARIDNLKVLIDCCHNEQKNISALLDYFVENHINESYASFFISNLINNTHTHYYDSENWAKVNKIFEKLEVFTHVDSNKSRLGEIANAIVVYNVLRGQPIPAVISEKSNIHLHETKYAKAKSFTEDERTLIFTHIYEMLSDKVKYDNEDARFIRIVHLLNDWNKDLMDFPVILSGIRERINRNDKSIFMIRNMYKTNKRWRRILFAESFLIATNENVCLNILKHDPNLITNYKRLQDLSRIDRLPVDKLLKTIRVYFKDDLLHYVLMVYKSSLTLCPEDHAGYQSVTRGFCILQDREQFRTFISAYVPTDSQIKWLEADLNINNIQKYLVGQMYLVRPTIDVATVMKFTGGDFLQYAVPSLLSIAYNMPKIELKDFVMKCLEGKVSIKKLAVIVATTKLDAGDVDEVLINVWETNKNYSLRAVLFQNLLDLLHSKITKQRDDIWMNALWGTLKKYIETLHTDEDRNIYLSLAKVNYMPKKIRPEFCKISYEFLKRLPKKLNVAELYHMVFGSVQCYFDNIDSNWIESVLLDYMKDVTSKKCSRCQMRTFQDVAVAYILDSETEDMQIVKYNKFLKPYFDYLLETLNEKAKCWTDLPFDLLLGILVTKAVKNMRFGKHVIPIRLFKTLKAEIEHKYPIYEIYTYICYLKLAIAYFESYKKWKQEPKDDHLFVNYNDNPEFVKRCIEILNNDASVYFASLYEDFVVVLKRLCDNVGISNLTVATALTRDNDNFVNTMAAVKLQCSEHRTVDFFAQHECLEVKLNYFSVINGTNFFKDSFQNNRSDRPDYSLDEFRRMESGMIPRAILESFTSKRKQRANIRRWPKRRRLHMRMSRRRN